MSKVYLVSGRTFDIVNPRSEDVRLIDIATGLANTCRFGGQLDVSRWYSVAQHSLLVSHFTGLMLEELGPYHRSIGKLLGLIHDASEAYMGDVITPIKQMPSMAPYRLLESKVQSVIEEALVDKKGLIEDDIWPMIRKMVKEADTAAMVIEAAHLQNRNLGHGMKRMRGITATKVGPVPNDVAKDMWLKEYFGCIAEIDRSLGEVDA